MQLSLWNIVFTVSCWLRLLKRIFHEICLVQRSRNQAAAAINIHNYNWSGCAALENVQGELGKKEWVVFLRGLIPQYLVCRQRQLAGILGFCFTNGFLAMKHFTDTNLKDHTFNMAAAQALTNYQTINLCKTRHLEKSLITEDVPHTLAKLLNSRSCYYCLHGYSTPQTNHKSTKLKCV